MSTNFLRLSRASLAMLACLAVTTVWSQDDLDFSSMSLEDLLNVEVTVASKSEETLADAPSSVTVYTRQEIQNMGVTHLEELLNFVPGFQTGRNADEGPVISTPAVRGRRGNSAAYDILILVNGQRLNESWTGGGLYMNHHIPLNNVKQVEIIRGPGSALYGSNAFLGVVNIVTVNDVNELSIGAGNLGSREAYANLSKKVGGWTIFGYAGMYTDDGENFENIHDFFGAPNDGADPLETLDFYVGVESEKFKIYFRHAQREHRNFTNAGGIAENLNGGQNESTSVNLSYQIIDNDKGSLKASAFYIEDAFDNVVQLFPPGIPAAFGLFPPSISDPLIGGADVDLSQTAIALDAGFNFGENNQLIAGLSFRDASIDEALFVTNFRFTADGVNILPGPEADPGNPFGSTGSRDVLGIYLQDKHKFNEKLTGTIGVRYDDYSDFGSTTNPRGALIYKEESIGATFKLMYGEAFRAPNVREQSELSVVSVGNPDLTPEEVTTLEFAWIQNFAKGQTSVTYFQSEITDGIALAPATVNIGGVPVDTLQPQNLVDLDLSGIEIEAQLFFSENFNFRGSITSFNDTEEAPRQLGETTASFIFNYNKSGWNWNINGFFHDDRETGEATLDSYWLLNSTLRYSWDNLSLEGRVRNLADEEYGTISNLAPLLGTGVPNRGSTFSLNLRMSL